MSAPYWTDGQVTLYHGDCRELLPGLTGVDLIFTSPPYNLGVTTGGGFGHWKDGQRHGGNQKWAAAMHDGDGVAYDRHDDAMPYREYEAWQRSCLAMMWATLSDCGAIFYNHKPRVQAKTLWLPLALNPDLPVRQIIVWARAGGMNFAPTHYCPTHEWIMIFAKPRFRLNDRGASGVGDVWRVQQEANPDHPAPFPKGLPARTIETTRPALVLDPFAGTGTTLRAAADVGVKAIGIEISERYCEIAARRLSQQVMTA